jgi:two-component system, OmpR family, response regulator
MARWASGGIIRSSVATRYLSRLHNDEVYDRSVDVQVGRLRRKMQAAKASAELIRTERGAGYAFVAQVEVVR